MAVSESTTPLSIHPAAEIFPLIEGAALTQLADDIRANGLREAITLHRDGRVLDGRNRLRACQLAGVEPYFRTWTGEGSPVAYVVSLNLHRRHLDESQRALVAKRIANLPRGNPQFGKFADLEAESAVSQIKAAEMLNVSPRSVGYAGEVIDHGAPELVRAVEQGEVAVSAAAQIVDLPREEQAAIVDLPEPERRAAIKAHVAHATGNNEWYTPPELIEAAKAAMGHIDLDPASSELANRTVGAKAFYTVADDGLKQPWRGNVWMNPPYAQPLVAQFSEAVSEKYDAKEIKRACVLVNNATETAWFQRMLTSASAVCFLKGRVRFLDPKGEPSGAPLQGQAVLYLGDNPFRFARGFEELGQVLVKPS